MVSPNFQFMKKHFVFLCLLGAGILGSCDRNTTAGQDQAQVSETANEPLPPVETKDPNTKYKPAFPGQTRAPGVKTSTSYEARVVTDGLDQPWGIVQLPDGRFLINQKTGTMRIVSPD